MQTLILNPLSGGSSLGGPLGARSEEHPESQAKGQIQCIFRVFSGCFSPPLLRVSPLDPSKKCLSFPGERVNLRRSAVVWKISVHSVPLRFSIGDKSFAYVFHSHINKILYNRIILQYFMPTGHREKNCNRIIQCLPSKNSSDPPCITLIESLWHYML